MFGGMKDMKKLMGEMKNMEANVGKIQEELAEERVEAQSGGGVVKCIANGKKEILKIEIDKEVIDPDDKEMLEDLILAAVTQALEMSTELEVEKMKELTGGIDIPGF